MISHCSQSLTWLNHSLTANDSNLPQRCSLPKIHNSTVSPKPTVNLIGSPSYATIKYLVKDFRHHQTCWTYPIPSICWKTLLWNYLGQFWCAQFPQKFLILFTIFQDILAQIILIYYCFEELHEQASSTRISSSVSLIVADIFIEAFEALTLLWHTSASQYKLKVCLLHVVKLLIFGSMAENHLRYIDWQQSVNRFLTKLENHSSLPFLVVEEKLEDFMKEVADAENTIYMSILKRSNTWW